MKFSLILAAILFSGGNAMAAGCSQAQIDEGGITRDLNDGGYFTGNERREVCVMPQAKKKCMIYLNADGETEERCNE